jgi:hypothetical protein
MYLTIALIEMKRDKLLERLMSNKVAKFDNARIVFFLGPNLGFNVLGR